jgi:hypothetical protein
VNVIARSVLRPDEFQSLRLDWVTPWTHRLDADAGWVALRVTVTAIADEAFQKEIWNPDRSAGWEAELAQLASDLEDWVCETSFAWGEQRTALLPE